MSNLRVAVQLAVLLVISGLKGAFNSKFQNQNKGLGQTRTVGGNQMLVEVLEPEAALSVYRMGSTIAEGHHLDSTKWPKPNQKVN